MKKFKSLHMNRFDRSTRIHFIVLYVLLAGMTMLWIFYLIYFTRTIRMHMVEFNRMKEQLGKLEDAQIVISSSSSVNEDDPSQRQSRHAALKSKSFGKDEAQDVDGLLGAIHFKVPVRLTEERFRFE